MNNTSQQGFTLYPTYFIYAVVIVGAFLAHLAGWPVSLGFFLFLFVSAAALGLIAECTDNKRARALPAEEDNTENLPGGGVLPHWPPVPGSACYLCGTEVLHVIPVCVGSSL